MSAPANWLVLLRHGHSEWNLSDRFTGWTDIPLTEVGLAEAAAAGRRLAQAGFVFDEVHGSVLLRTRQTAEVLLTAMGTPAVPFFASWRLNERHYGALQGMNKREIFATWGEEASRRWWRGYYEPPPALDIDDPRHPRFDPLYAALIARGVTRQRKPARLSAAHPAVLARGAGAATACGAPSAGDQPRQHPARAGHASGWLERRGDGAGGDSVRGAADLPF